MDIRVCLHSKVFHHDSHCPMSGFLNIYDGLEFVLKSDPRGNLLHGRRRSPKWDFCTNLTRFKRLKIPTLERTHSICRNTWESWPPWISLITNALKDVTREREGVWIAKSLKRMNANHLRYVFQKPFFSSLLAHLKLTASVFQARNIYFQKGSRVLKVCQEMNLNPILTF